jgi:hypothetical protein
MRTTIRVSALFFGVAAGLLAHDAHALGPLDLEIGVKAGAGTVPGGGSGPNPLGFGLGGRAGVSIFGLYGGLSLLNYFGESQTLGPFKTSAKSLMYGVEGGYGSSLGPLTLRAQVGVGNYSETVDLTVSGGAAAGMPVPTWTGTRNSLYIEPGLTAMIAFGTVFIGADANVLLLPNDPNPNGQTSFDAAFTAHGQVGVKF